MSNIEALSELLEMLDENVLRLKNDKCDFYAHETLLEAVSLLDQKTYNLFTTFVTRTVVHGILFNLQNKVRLH